MAKQSINLGSQANDGTGDSIRDAFDKVNTNFTEVYNDLILFNTVFSTGTQDLSGSISAINGFTATIANFSATQALFQQDLNDVANRLSGFQGTLTSQTSRINSLEDRATKLESTVTDLVSFKSAFATTGSLTGARYVAITTLVSNSTASIATRLTTLESSYTNFVSTTYATISYLDTAVANSTASIASSLQTLTSAFATTGSLAGASFIGLTSLITSSTASFATRISTLESNYSNLSTSTSATASVSYVDTAVSNSTASIASSLQTLTSAFATTGSLTGANFVALTNLVTSSTASFATRISTLESSFTNFMSTSGASISYVDTAVSNSTASIASSLQTLQSSFNNITGTITTLASVTATVAGIQSKYGVSLNANGHVAGFQILNSSTGPSSFIIQADKFSIETNNGSLTPFSVVGDTVSMQNVEISSTLKVGTNPVLSGTTMTGIGAVINSNGTFAMGNGTKNITFDGSVFTINGDLIGTGNIGSNAVTNYSTVSSSTPGYLVIPVDDKSNVSAATIDYMSSTFQAAGTGFVTITWDATSIPGWTDQRGGRIPVILELWRSGINLGVKGFVVDTPGPGTHTYYIKAKLSPPLGYNNQPWWSSYTAIIGDGGSTAEMYEYFTYSDQTNFLINRPTITDGQLTIVEYKK